MKKVLIVLGVIICTHNFAQIKENTPSCFKDLISNQKEGMPFSISYGSLKSLLYKGDTLYSLKKDYKDIRFVKAPIETLQDKNCNVLYSSKDLNIYTDVIKQSKTIETLYVKPVDKPAHNMKTFLNTKRKFQVLNTSRENVPLEIPRHSYITVSLKNGLQLLEKGKVKKSYKIEPVEKLQYNPISGKSTPANDGFSNAVLLKQDNQYWVLYSKNAISFELRASDETGSINALQPYYSLLLQK